MRGSKAGLADLKQLRKALATRAEAARAQQAAAQGAAAAAAPGKDDALLFRQAMRSVTPMKAPARVLHQAPPVRADLAARRRAVAAGEPDGRADAGVSDGEDVSHLLSENGTAFVRKDAAPDTARKLRRGHWRTGAELDLHGLRVEQARHAVLTFLDECLEHGIRCVRIVHGKGHGSQGMTPVLKEKTRTWLVQKPEVQAFSEAPEREGGSGALLVLLRQAETRRP